MSAVTLPQRADPEGRTAARSCLTCAKAKAKCVRQLGKLSCERCSRLNKECHTKEVTIRKRKHSKLTRSEQLEKLESKIEHLVYAFSSQQGAPATGTELSPPDSQATSDRSNDAGKFHFVSTGSLRKDGQGVRQDRGLELLEKICQYEEEAHRLKKATIVDQHQSTAESIQSIESRMRSSMGEVYLERYQRLMADGCPFVKIPLETTFEAAYQQRPLLMMAITVVASFHDLPRQQSMAKDFMRMVTERIFFRSEKSIDVLQALLIFITWNHPHLFWSQQISTLLHLAIAQALDLSTDRWGHAMDRSKFETAAHKAVHGSNSVQKSTLEERRAILGIFYLTSILSSTFRKMDAVKWTPWHDECLKVLEAAQEYESDSLLVAMIKLQVLVEDLSAADTTNAPVHAFIKLYHRDMERLRASNPESESNLHLRSQFIAAEVYLWELTYADLFEMKKSARVMHRHHAEGIYKCIEAVKTNLDFFASIPPSSYFTLPFQTFVTFAQAFMSMLRLATLEAEGWDIRNFREQMDILSLIDRGAKCYEEASKGTIDGMPINNDCFTRWAAKLRWSRQMYETKMGHDVSTDNSNPAPYATTEEALLRDDVAPVANPALAQCAEDVMQPPNVIQPSNMMQYMDDPFWSNFTFDFDFSSTDFSTL